MLPLNARTAAPLGSPLAAIEGLYGRAVVAGKDFEVHDQLAYAITSLVAQWDDVVSKQEHTDKETEAMVWEAAWQAACHPFVIEFGDGWTSLISVPTLTLAWKVAEKEALSYGCNVRKVACVRRCWHCLLAETEYDRAAREVIGDRVAQQVARAAEASAGPDGLRRVVRTAHDGQEPRLSDSSVQPVHLADPGTNGHQQG